MMVDSAVVILDEIISLSGTHVNCEVMNDLKRKHKRKLCLRVSSCYHPS